MTVRNRLAGESSPYLRQHADNPVDWYPWGDEAFTKARDEDKPIMLSIGYSACHWCHVMAHESFEDPAVATVMNESCVNVKIDREERPDVDAIYMEATQAMTGSGGWPMTVFLDTDRRPFYAGTYYPKAQFLELLAAVRAAWVDRREELLAQAAHLTDTIRERSAVTAPLGEVGISRDMLDVALRALSQAFDGDWGGFGRAPKFPMPSNLELLMRSSAPGATTMVTTTLDAMACGGIYDHVGGGFARYSVDRTWTVPHFEKMLYDNAQLARVYLHAWQLTGEARYRQVLEETIGYVLRDLRLEEGGVCSAEDADSEGEEGRFYVWRPEQFAAILGNLTEAAAAWYGVSGEGNFENGATILRRPLQAELRRSDEIERARQLLFDARALRVRPGRDDKVLAEWNAMFVAALAEAGAATGRHDWVQAAAEVGAFLKSSLRRPDGRWLRSWQRDAGAKHLAYAADYAHLVDAFTRLAEATGQASWIADARQTADALLALFWDDDAGGLWTTGADAEELLLRSKDVYDGATPSAGSVAAVALLRLGALTGDDRYAQASHGILRLLHDHLAHQPTAVTVALAAVDMVISGTSEVVVSGDRPDLVKVAHAGYRPNAVLAWGEPYPSPLWEGRDKPAGYVCRDFVCALPATTVEDFEEQLVKACGR